MNKNLKDNRKHGRDEEIVKISNRFGPLSSEEDIEDVSNIDSSDKVIIEKSKVIEKIKEKKKIVY